MRIESLTKDSYSVWDKFCQESDDACFWHASGWLDYSLIYRPGVKTHSLSFMVYDDRDLVAICPLLIEALSWQGDNYKVFSNVGCDGYLVVPALKNGLTKERRDKILKYIFSYIDELAAKNEIKKASFRFSPLIKKGGTESLPWFNYLVKFGYLDFSSNTQIIDLNLSLENLQKAIRKGHKHNIVQGQREFVVDVFDQNNISDEIFQQYRIMHHKAAGRVTRPNESFEIMKQWVKNGQAALFGAKYQDKYVGFTLIFMFGSGAYYGSAADDPDIDLKISSAHVIQWQIISWLKEQGVKTYELGPQVFSPQISQDTSPEELNISFFKRGFGGQTIPLLRATKYYDRDFLAAELGSKLKKLK